MSRTTIRNAIIQKLYAHTSKPIIQGNQNQDKPAYPFLAYNITSPYIKGLGQSVKEVEVIEIEEVDNIRETNTDQSQFVISFTAYDKDMMVAVDLAILARNYFLSQGNIDLPKIDVAIIEVGNIESRDTLIVDDYERRQGFDVRFRLVHKSTYTYETIEQVNINYEEE